MFSCLLVSFFCLFISPCTAFSTTLELFFSVSKYPNRREHEMGYLYILCLIILSSIHAHCAMASNKRQAIEIVIGGSIGIGGNNGSNGDVPTDCPPPPVPTDCPPPPLLSPEPESQPPSPPPKSPSPPPKQPESPPPKPPSPPPKQPESPPPKPPSPPPKSPSPPPKQPESPPPKPPSPPPLIFVDQRLFAVYPVIQKFRKLITSDPLGITDTWVGADVCNYKGFFCDTPPDNSSATALASIDFNGFQLGAPTLGGFLDALPDLALFHANSNNFGGTISSKILKLPYLYELDISNNQFSGAFPSALLAPNNITFLDIRYNSFSGSVPPQIFARDLQVLFINNNNFKAQLPANIGNTSVLYLTLANNKLTGQIPSSLGKATSLMEILLLNNQLSGCLPYEIGYLKGLTVFDAGNNQLTGPIPCSFACLNQIEQLNLAGNSFFGPVPELVCALSNLENLSLSGNYFTQVGPICRGLVRRGVLDLKMNCVPGLPFQRSPIDCAMFFSHPRWCPHTGSYNYIPCKPSHNANTTSSSSKAPSPTYSALTRHRL